MTNFHDANLPGYSKSGNDKSGTMLTSVDDSNEEDEKKVNEVKLLDATWVAGPKGFQYNEQCFLDVNVKILQKSARKRIRGKLYGIYNNQKEEDLSYEAEGFYDVKTEVARLTIKYLFYVNNDHYKDWQQNPSVKAQYIIKGIYHTLGENIIDSPILEMPAVSSSPDDIFDNDLFLYSPADAVYYRIAKEHVDGFYQAVDECNDFVSQIEEARNQISKSSGKAVDAAIKKMGEIKENFAKYLKEQHTTAKGSEKSSAMGSADPGMDNELKEFIALNKIGKTDKNGKSQANYKGWCYIRSDKMKSHWRKTPESKLIDLFGPEEKDGGELKKEIKDKFKEKILKPLKQENVLFGSDEEKDILAPKWVFKTDEKGSKSEHWDFSAGAQFLRFSAGVSVKSEVNLKNLETNVEVAGSASFALAEGKTEGYVYIPDKNGFNVAEFLIKSQKKLWDIYGENPTRKSNRSAYTPAQRTLFLRLKMGFKASGFIGASASIAFPRLEIKPVKGDDPKSERVALATLEGKAFVGGKGEGEVLGDVSWAKSAMAKSDDWKSMVSLSVGGAVCAGLGAEGKLHFGYKDGHVRFSCSLQATFVVGGKVSWDYDIGLVEGLEFISQLALCVDFHYIASIAEDLYEIMGAYKYAMLVTPQTSVLLGGLYVLKDIDEHAEKAKQFVKDVQSQYQQVTNFVDKSIQNGLFGVDKKELQFIKKQAEYIRKTPPESIARYLLVVMKVPENDDYIYITEILSACESDHKVRWVVRFVGLLTTLYEISRKHSGAPTISFKGIMFEVKNTTVIASNSKLFEVMKTLGINDEGKEKDVMLEKGADVLLKFGKYKTDNQVDTYIGNISAVFYKNGVHYE